MNSDVSPKSFGRQFLFKVNYYIEIKKLIIISYRLYEKKMRGNTAHIDNQLGICYSCIVILGTRLVSSTSLHPDLAKEMCKMYISEIIYMIIMYTFN